MKQWFQVLTIRLRQSEVGVVMSRGVQEKKKDQQVATVV